jgi:hypothetical protein
MAPRGTLANMARVVAILLQLVCPGTKIPDPNLGPEVPGVNPVVTQVADKFAVERR